MIDRLVIGAVLLAALGGAFWWFVGVLDDNQRLQDDNEVLTQAATEQEAQYQNLYVEKAQADEQTTAAQARARKAQAAATAALDSLRKVINDDPASNAWGASPVPDPVARCLRNAADCGRAPDRADSGAGGLHGTDGGSPGPAGTRPAVE